MSLYKDLFTKLTEFFTDQGVKYRVVSESDNIVELLFAGRAHKDGGGIDTKVIVDFDEQDVGDGTVTVHLASLSCGKIKDENVPEAIVRINGLNRSFRWVKFWFDDRDNTLNGDADAIVAPESVGPELLHYIIVMSNIVEDALIEMKDIVDPDGGMPMPTLDELEALLELLRGMQSDNDSE